MPAMLSGLFSDPVDRALLRYLPIEPCAAQPDHEFFDACFTSLSLSYGVIQLGLFHVPVQVFLAAGISFLMYRKLTDARWRLIGFTFPLIAVPTVVGWLTYSYVGADELVGLLAVLLGLMIGSRYGGRAPTQSTSRSI
ncbi:MAG: hypothetical protein ACOY3E_14740 [Pseudomonadota bacterium]